MSVKKLKRVVIKEEFVELTGDIRLAILLNQMIYWSERVKDFDFFIREEMKRASSDGSRTELELQKGWVYKKANDLIEETMMGVSETTMRRLLLKLVENKWLDERSNPKFKWDKTSQYRVNLIRICKDLQKIGYTLSEYKIDFSKIQSDYSNLQNEDSRIQVGGSYSQDEDSNRTNDGAIPEITTETTPDITPETTTTINHVIQFYINNFGIPTPYIQENIEQWCVDLSAELVFESLKIALEKNNRSFGYAKAILKNWVDRGYKTLQEMQAGEKLFTRRPTSKNKTEMKPGWLSESKENTNQQHQEFNPTDEERRKFEELLEPFKE